MTHVYFGARRTKGERIGPHALRAQTAIKALYQKADITKMQEQLGHVNIATTRIYDRRETMP